MSMTIAELNHELTELNVEFRKIVDGGNTREALCWLVTVLEFSEAAAEEAYNLKHQTVGEAAEIFRTAVQLRELRSGIRNCLSERVRSDSAQRGA
jgi:hypothetical protein